MKVRRACKRLAFQSAAKPILQFGRKEELRFLIATSKALCWAKSNSGLAAQKEHPHTHTHNTYTHIHTILILTHTYNNTCTHIHTNMLTPIQILN